MKFPRLREAVRDASRATSEGSENIDAILEELKSQALTTSKAKDDPAPTEEAAGGETEAPAAVAEAAPTEVAAVVAPPSGEAPAAVVPPAPVWPPAPNQQLAGPRIRVQANVPAADADAGEMTIEEQDEMAKLDEAVGAINEDLMHYVKQINDETKWVTDVRGVVTTYETKTKRVEDNISGLKKTVAGLYKKKKQMENLKYQKYLELKLRSANSDLTTLEKAMAHVKSKQDEFTKSKTDVMDTISGLETQLAVLKGKPAPTKESLEKESAAIEAHERRTAEYSKK